MPGVFRADELAQGGAGVAAVDDADAVHARTGATQRSVDGDACLVGVSTVQVNF